MHSAFGTLCPPAHRGHLILSLCPTLSLPGNTADSATPTPLHCSQMCQTDNARDRFGAFSQCCQICHLFLFLKLFPIQSAEHLLCTQAKSSQPENLGVLGWTASQTILPMHRQPLPGSRVCSCCPVELGCQKMKDEFCLLLLPCLRGCQRITASSCFLAFYTCSVLF